MVIGINKLEEEIAEITDSHGCTLYGFADPINIRGDFQHKTAATKGGTWNPDVELD